MIPQNWRFGCEFEFTYTGGDQYAFAQVMNQWLRAQGIARVCVGRGYEHTNNPREWTCKTDGSVNGNGRGLELVPPILMGPEGLWELYYVCTEFLRPLEENGEIRVNRSCGTHVHHSGSGFNETEIRNLYDGWTANGAVVETIVFAACSPSRQDNKFCRKTNYRNRIATFDMMRDRENYNHFNIGDARYFGLNLKSYWVRGTVEYRMHQGTIDGTKIINWLSFTSRITQILAGGGSITDADSMRGLQTMGRMVTRTREVPVRVPSGTPVAVGSPTGMSVRDAMRSVHHRAGSQASAIDNSVRTRLEQGTQSLVSGSNIEADTGLSRERIMGHLNHLVSHHGIDVIRGRVVTVTGTAPAPRARRGRYSSPSRIARPTTRTETYTERITVSIPAWETPVADRVLRWYENRVEQFAGTV